MEVDGYELLYREHGAPPGPIADHDAATHRTLAEALVEVDLEELVGGRRIFMHVTSKFLHDGWHRLLPPGRTVLELVDVRRDDDLADLLFGASCEGYHVAAGGYQFDADDDWMLDHVDVVKVDVSGIADDVLRAGLRRLEGRPVTLLAEKVETVDQHQRCRELGFDLFQGYFFQRPQLVERRAPAAARTAVLQLIAALETPDAGAEQLAAIIERDPALTFKLLRLVNSVQFALPRRVESVRDCVVLLGSVQIRQLAMLLAMAVSEEKPAELSTTLLVRAKMCERVARRIGREDAAFTAGVLSLIDAVVDQPIDQALACLPVAPEIADAVLERAGSLGRILDAVVAFEQGDLDAPSRLGVSAEIVDEAYLSAIAWARDIAQTVVEPGGA